MLKVTKCGIQFYWNKHVTYRQTWCGHLLPCNGFHPICCTCLLATELNIQDYQSVIIVE